ncbi:hypothetical protein PLICRDRAFT_167256 [Plicaturopsis crispa FD-325 SS-3]|uniref:PIPK domain-containing protein n=1 Tax=Plicaturopsis crispa FD-325 SS-3 TaxID=944288 RepID=A0A0C9SRN6_PLICR|nr:hypothetical protein PLICRDRAFT_167256 [Plicaturopsis crispa FD-325 SS-3]
MSAASTSQKPLPPVPRHYQVHTLTVDARAHLRHLIEGSISDEDQRLFTPTEEKIWADAIETALIELGENVVRGGWLAGLKRGRRVVKERESERSREEANGKGKEKEKDEPPQQDETAETSGEGPTPSPSRLDQIRDTVSRPALPTPKPSIRHLLLCLAPMGSESVLPVDSDFALVPHNPGCIFTNSVFALPEAEDEAKNVVLYGYDDFHGDVNKESPLRIIGGTFSFKGVPSAAHHAHLAKTLRLSIYTFLSLILEQAFLSDASAPLRFPISKPAYLPPPPPMDRRPATFDVKSKIASSRSPFLGGGIFSYFSKKTEDLIQRATPKRSSLDVPRPPSPSAAPVDTSVSTSPQAPSVVSSPYATALMHITRSSSLLSTTPGTIFPPPPLLVTLAEKETQDPTRRLKGDEKAALGSLIGWEGRESRGRGMGGTSGFVRMQGISMLVSTRIIVREPSEGNEEPIVKVTRCDRAKWKTFRYYARDGQDRTLGEAVEELCGRAGEPCNVQECTYSQGDHEVRWLHGGVRVVIGVKDDPAVEERKNRKESDIEVWESCQVCSAKTRRKVLSDGAYLLSFGKFLEMLVYSPSLSTLSPRLCEHTTTSPRDILRHFNFAGHTATITLSTIEDVFELRVPRLQILRNGDKDREKDRLIEKPPEIKDETSTAEDEKRVLRREVMQWWQGVYDHIDKLEMSFNADRPDSWHKSLPRLPSTDDPYVEDEPTATPKAAPTGLPSHSPRAPSSPTPTEVHSIHSSSDYANSASTISDNSTSSHSSSTHSSNDSDPATLLANLRQAFQRTEQTLYIQLARTPVSALNDVRRAFLSSARGASRRLASWQKKHLRSTVEGQKVVGDMNVQEPSWWEPGCHAVPGSNVIARENDWGSIIAFTLSSSDFQQELAKLSGARSQATTAPSPPLPTATPKEAHSSFFSVFTSSTTTSPDPDQDDIIWHEPEEYTAKISRKEHPRDPTSLLSIREVLRHKNAEGTIGLGLAPSRFGSAARTASGATPRSAWAKPAVEVSMEAADGVVVSGLPETVASAGKRLLEMGAASADTPPRPEPSMSDYGSQSAFGDAHIRSGKASSIISVDSDMTIGPDSDLVASPTQLPPPVPSKSGTPQSAEENSTPSRDASPSTFAASLTNSLTTAMRFMMSSPDIPRPMTPNTHHGLLSIDALGLDERPHIKYDWTLGKRLKFSCTAYYAKQFDALRRRCGIDNVFLKSLARSANWAAEGGKSKSNFWKTSDDRYIIKTLVNAWNVADLQVLIELAPSYFRYMDATASKPTVLAKLLGFYTVEIKNLESGTTQAKADLLIMENLFYDQKISKTFDLKGIPGRKVKAGPTGVETGSKTLFDGEWIEGQQRTLTLVHPHSQVVLREAIRRDCEFLAQSNIMDYSLLLGIDAERKQIACGLVDTIGSYTFAKTLEYKAKQGLNTGKDITVIPPNEYQDRFVSAIESYFLACPDKWSRPMDGTKVPSDPAMLPCVL